MGNSTSLVEMDGEESEELENIIVKCADHFHLPKETMIKIMALVFQKKTGVFRKNDMVYLERTLEIPIDKFLRTGQSLSCFPKSVLDKTIAVHTQVMIRDDDEEYDYADGAAGESVALLIPRELLKDSTHTSDDIAFYKRMTENGNEHAMEILESVLKQENPEEFYRMKVKNNGDVLGDVPEQFRTKELCRLAVEDSGWALEYVPEPLKTEELCRIAVENDEYALQCVPESLRTEELCRMVVKNSRSVLCGVPEPLKTEELCRMAVKNNGSALQYVPKSLKTEELCRIAVENNGWALQYVPKPLRTEELCRIAAENDGLALEYIRIGW